MFFLLRALAIIAMIHHFSPVHETRTPGSIADSGAFGMSDFDRAAIEERVLAALDDPRYENWTAVPGYARDRLAIEIARQLADAALAPPPPRAP